MSKSVAIFIWNSPAIRYHTPGIYSDDYSERGKGAIIYFYFFVRRTIKLQRALKFIVIFNLKSLARNDVSDLTKENWKAKTEILTAHDIQHKQYNSLPLLNKFPSPSVWPFAVVQYYGPFMLRPVQRESAVLPNYSVVTETRHIQQQEERMKLIKFNYKFLFLLSERDFLSFFLFKRTEVLYL